MQFRTRNGNSGRAGRLALAVPLAVALVVGSIAAAPAGAAVPKLSPLYHMKLHNSSENVNSTGVIAGIKQTGGKIAGKVILAPPLYGGGPFKGTVGASAVKFTVTSTPGNPCHCVSIAFTGTIGPKGTMNGTYVATTTAGTENGTWAATPHSTFGCELRSRANHKYVTAEINYPATLSGLMRARSPGVGTWQMFKCVAVGKDQWALKSPVNQKFVSAQLNAPGASKGVLRAAAASVGAGQTFSFQPVAACGCYALKAANSRFVTVDSTSSSDTTGLLRAQSTTVAARQQFDITAT